MRLSLSDRKVRAFVWQAIVVCILAAIGFWLLSNTLTNLEARRINSGFAFLQRPAAMPIGESVIAYAPGASNMRAVLVGLLNTLLVSVLGIVLSTVVGVAIGLARLSRNWLVARLASVYVEYVRNVPLLAHLLLIYVALQGLPPLRSAWTLGNIVFLSNRGLVIPTLSLGGDHWPVAAAFLAGIGSACALIRHARRKRDRTGRRSRPVASALALAIGLPLLAFVLSGATLQLSVPHLQGPNFVGGYTLSPELTALLAGLTIYSGAFIAEIVRGGILAIPQAQWEAGYAVGLPRRRVLWLVVLPQALRLILPPTTNQYLDLAKSSSLAIAIGYPDLVAVINGIITDTGQAIEGVAMIMGAFLAINLLISALMNWFNMRVSLVER
jgi:general L-amino acid transport system permease protein